MQGTIQGHTPQSDASPPHPVEASCPSCGSWTLFTWIGVQRWPPRVAAALKTGLSTNLWRCESCLTTVSEVEMKA